MAKTRLLERGMTVGQLATKIGKTRSATSQAIHHGRFPRVLQAIRHELSL